MTDTNQFAIFAKPVAGPSDWAFRACRLDAVSDSHYAAARAVPGMDKFPQKDKMPQKVTRLLDHGAELAYADKMTAEGLDTFIVLDEAAHKAAPALKTAKGLCWINDYRKALPRGTTMPGNLKTAEHKVADAIKYDPKVGKLKKSDPALHEAYVSIRNRASIYVSGQWKKWKRHYEEATAATKKKKGTRTSSLAFREWFFKTLSETVVDRAKTAASRKTPDASAPSDTAKFAAWIKEVMQEFDDLCEEINGAEQTPIS